jgi:hypothetical protein
VSVDNPTPAPADEAMTEDAADKSGDPIVPENGASTPPTRSRSNSEERDSHIPQQEGPAEEKQWQEVLQEPTDWLDLPMLAKLDSMHRLTEWQFQNPTRLRTLMKSDDEDATWVHLPVYSFLLPLIFCLHLAY